MSQGGIVLGGLFAAGNDALGEPHAHVEGPVAEIPEFVGQLRVEKHDQTLDIEVGVLAGMDVAHEVVSQRIASERIGQLDGIDDVAEGFRHFFPASVPPAVDQDVGHPVIGETERMQHRKPIDAMRGNKDVLADDVHGSPGPDGLEIRKGRIRRVTDERDVVDQCVEPDISDEIRVKRQFDAPSEAGFRAGDTEIRSGGFFQSVDQLGFAESRQDGVVGGFQEIPQPWRVFR